MSASPSTLAAPARARRLPNPAAVARLRPNEVDLWQAELDSQTPDVVNFMQTLISADEAERARRFYFERDRRRFVVGRGILRTLLGKYLGCPAKQLVLRYGPHGKPSVATGAGSPLFFNVAHSEGLALYAFTRTGEVGVDLERIRDIPEWETIANSHFLPREFGRIKDCGEARRREEFFRAWARQEAVLKARGIGLGGALGAGALDERGPSDRLPAGRAFAVYPLEPGPGFVGALAVGPAAQWITNFRWQAREATGDVAFAGSRRRVRLKPILSTGPDTP